MNLMNLISDPVTLIKEAKAEKTMQSSWINLAIVGIIFAIGVAIPVALVNAADAAVLGAMTFIATMIWGAVLGCTLAYAMRVLGGKGVMKDGIDLYVLAVIAPAVAWLLASILIAIGALTLNPGLIMAMSLIAMVIQVLGLIAGLAIGFRATKDLFGLDSASALAGMVIIVIAYATSVVLVGLSVFDAAISVLMRVFL